MVVHMVGQAVVALGQETCHITLRDKIDGSVVAMLAGWENHRRWTVGDYFPIFGEDRARQVIQQLRTTFPPSCRAIVSSADNRSGTWQEVLPKSASRSSKSAKTRTSATES